MVWIFCQITAAAATATPCTPLKAYAAAGTGSTAITTTVPIWAGVATAGAAFTWTRQTDAVAYTTAATAGVHQVILQIDPAQLGWEATVPSLGEYKYLSCTVTGLVADYVSCTFLVKPRYVTNDVATTRWIA